MRETILDEKAYLDLPYLELKTGNIQREFLILGGLHARIVDLFKECYDGAFSRDDRWKALRTEAAERGAALGQLFNEPPAAPAPEVEE